MRKILVLVVTLVFLAVSFGCQTSRALTDGKSNVPARVARQSLVRGVPTRGNLQPYECHELEYMASVVRPEVWEMVRSITIDNVATHYGPSMYIIAHCHSPKDEVAAVPPGSFGPPDGRDWQVGDICLKSEAAVSIVFWHEIAHAWHFRLKTRHEFEDEWRQVAGDVYGRDNNPPGTIYPTRGLLRRYSGQQLREDVADTFMFVISEIHGGDAPYERLLAGADWQDFRYREKVRLLWRYGFLSDEDYRKFSDMAGLD